MALTKNDAYDFFYSVDLEVLVHTLRPSGKQVKFPLKSKHPFQRFRLHSDPLLEKHQPSLCCTSQELTWRHAQASNSVSRSSESLWPELLLQANIEQVRKKQTDKCCWRQQRRRTHSASLPSACSLTKCRRVSSPWSNRPQRSRPTCKDLERELGEDFRGLLLRVIASRRHQFLNKPATCQRNITSLRPLGRPPRPLQIPALLGLCVRGQLCTFLPLWGACADPEGGSERFVHIVNSYKRK